MRAPKGIYSVAQSKQREKSGIEPAAEKICRRLPGDTNAEARAVIRDLADTLESLAYMVDRAQGTPIARAADELIDLYVARARGGASE